MCLACAPVALRISRSNPPGCDSEFGSRQALLASSATLNAAGSLSYVACGSGALRSFTPLFDIQVGLELLWGHVRLDALGRHLDLCDPQQRIEHDLPKICVAPVSVEMAASEADATRPIRTFDAPHDVLGFAFVFSHLRIAAV